MKTSTLMRWSIRLLGLLAMVVQAVLMLSFLADDNFLHWDAAVIIDIAARVLIGAGYVAALRYERIGGGVMILGAAVLSAAIYAWAHPLGVYVSTLIGVHAIPAVIVGVLFLSVPRLHEDELDPELQESALQEASAD